ncbi:MAG: NUDIX domain-containing protein [Myxococcota bacterium]|nr:NUDIX domain-containing protein [Myxococcota bacterium]
MPSFVYCPKCGTALVDFTDHEDRIRQRCPSCRFIHYDNPTPVVAAIVEHDGEIILVQNKGWPAHFFGLVSGFLEKDEEPAEAVLREVEEELGLKGELVSFVGIYSFSMMNQVILTWHVRASGDVVVGEELAAIKRVARHTLRPWSMGTGKAVADWLSGRTNT